MEVCKKTPEGKKKRKFIPRIQKTRLAEIEANLKLLLAKGMKLKQSDSSILATAPRELLRPITMELYASLTSFEKAEFRQGCRKVVDGQVKIDKDKLRRVLFDKDKIRLDKLQDFLLKRRKQRKQVAEERSDLDMREPGALLKFGALQNKQAMYAMTGNNAAYALAIEVDGVENDLLSKKRKPNKAHDAGSNKPAWDLPERIPTVIKPEISQDIADAKKAAANIQSTTAGLTAAYMYFLEKCKFQIGDKRKATIKRRCDNEGFLVEVCGKICALHVSQLFAKLDDFAEPLSWFNEGQEVSVYIRDVLELEQCPFLMRVKGLSGNLIASTTFIPPDEWLMKIPTQFVVYKCLSDQVSVDKLSVCLGPTLKGYIPFQNWDEKLLHYGPNLKDGTAINVYTFRLERTPSKFNDFMASRVPKDDCDRIQKGAVLPIVRMNISNIMLPCKSRYNSWKVLLPLTEADDNFSETTRYDKLVSTLGVIMAVNEKNKTAIVSTRKSRLKRATRETILFSLLPRGPIAVEDRGIVNARLLYDKKGSELRGFVVRVWDENRAEILLGMDYLRPIMGHLKDESSTMHKRLDHLSVVRVRLLEDKFETKNGVLVEVSEGGPLAQGSMNDGDRDRAVESTKQDPCQDGSHHDAPATELADEDGFDWDYDAQPNLSVLAKETMAEQPDSSSSSDEEDISTPVNKTRKEREEDRRRKEVAMRKAEIELNGPSDSGNMPRTAEEFDRLVMASPNDGSLWVRYMAHHLQQLEVDKARQVAKRGLKIIRGSEADKLSLWLACLNLENMYGTQESLDSAFKEALKENDPIKVYSHLAKIYGLAGKVENARDTYQIMLKKFRQHRDVWVDFGSWLFDIGNFQEARQLMKRSFSSLTEKEHVEIILKFAQLELTKGERDYGKSLMDNLLLSYPKRLDIWNVYIDQLIKLKDFECVRMNFTKLSAAKLPLRKMKSVFKKWIDFEAKQGSPESVEEVKQKVVDYIDLDRT